MSVEILKRERTGTGWVRYWGAVNGVKVGVRLPLITIDGLSDSEAESEVKDALQSEFHRLHKGEGGSAEVCF